MNTNNTKDDKSDGIPPHVWAIVHELLLGYDNKNLDFQEPHLRPSVAGICSFIVLMYAILVGVGVILNFYVFVHIARNKLFNDATYGFIINNVISDMVKCICVVPISLYVLLIQNWTLGELLCSFLPMLQDIPMHTTTLTFLFMAWDRFRLIQNPNKPRLPAFVCAIGTWLTSICLVLPYPIYIIYVDLGKHMAPLFENVGICLINLADDMQEYMRGIFIFMYAGPIATISYLYIRVSRELQTQQSSMAVIRFEARGKDTLSAGVTMSEVGGRPRTDSHSTATDFRSSRGDCDRSSQYSRSSYRDPESSRVRYESYDLELDIVKEKRAQKYLVAMVTAYAICMCPLMVLRLARLALLETYDNSGHFDITYTTFVWVAFVPTCTTPIMYIMWQMSRSSKERLRGYFRFSNRKLQQSCETVITAAGTPATVRSRDAQIGDSTQPLQSDSNSLQQDIASS